MMPDLKEAIARLRELQRIIFSPHHTVSVSAIQEFRELVIENAGPLLDAAEEVEKLRAALAVALRCYVVRCHRRQHKPLRFPLCQDCQADARMEEITHRFRQALKKKAE